jgi:DNA (cytosine-5)-methyltransferase 1
MTSMFRGPAQSAINFGEMVIDNFAGGGGASTGIEIALGRPVDVAINHDIDAIRMHEVNHPHTKHYCESVWDIDPMEVTQGRPVGLAWFSPDCKHFSKARGGTPVNKKIRGLAWVALRWAATVKPRIIMLENVEEFTTWGPLRTNEDGSAYPCPKRKGQTFKAFINALERQGYKVDYRELRASDYGTPTIRKRLFLIARRDGLPIVWPEQTHGADLVPQRTAAECIDWSIPCPSIFTRSRALAESTQRRIAAGIMRFVVNSKEPFIVEPGISPFITEHANATHQPNMPGDEPLRTICAEVKGGHFALVSAFLAKHYTGVVGVDLGQPMPTVTTVDHNAVVIANLEKLDGFNSSRPETGGKRTSVYQGQRRDMEARHQGETLFIRKHRTETCGESSEERVSRSEGVSGGKAIYGSCPSSRLDGNERRDTERHGPESQGREQDQQLPDESGCCDEGGEPQTCLQHRPSSAVEEHAKAKVEGSGIVGKETSIKRPDISANSNQSGNIRDASLESREKLVHSFLIKFYSQGGQWQSLKDPMHTIPTKDRIGLVMVKGEPYQIVDIGMRMLSPRELFNAQGFPGDYIIDHDGKGKGFTKKAQVARCGNSVCPPMAAALVRANMCNEAQQAAA